MEMAGRWCMPVKASRATPAATATTVPARKQSHRPPPTEKGNEAKNIDFLGKSRNPWKRAGLGLAGGIGLNPAFPGAGYSMARRRKKNDDLFWAEAIAGITIPLVGLSILIPGFRILVFGIVAIVLVMAFVLVIGFLAYKVAKEKRTPSQPRSTVLWPDFVPKSKPEIKPIERLREIDWFQFERFVAYVYRQRGYNVTRKGGANPDGGIDMVIEKDGQRFAVQCKHWKKWSVGEKVVREFLGALKDSGIEKGIFVSLNDYTGPAKQLAERQGIQLINEPGLWRLADGLDLRNPEVQEIFSDTRKICPKCERPLVLRTARKGLNAGGQFWGCSGFPQGCTFKMSV